MMDRPSTSTNPLFLEQDDDMSSYVTKTQLFCAHRALHQEQLALGDHIDNLATDLRQSEQRTRDYFDTSMSSLKEDIQTMMVRSSTTSSSSRRSRSSRSSSERKQDASATRPRPHLHGDHHHVRDPPHHEGQVTSKQHVHDDDERHLLRAQARQRHHHHDDAPQAQMHSTSPTSRQGQPS